jgi:hypothetical protein
MSRRKQELIAQTGQLDPDMSEVRKAINRKARDNARTPMPVSTLLFASEAVANVIC